MPGVFISYRRDDSGGYAGRLFDILSARFGRENTFMDLDAIAGGDNFVTVIEQKVGLCEVLLAVIGERWLTITGADGTRRLDSPGDFVRLEIAKALERGVRVIPVLVSKATMPRQEDLPDDLRPLSLREAIDLRDEHFRDDANRLIALLEKTAPGISRRPWKVKPSRLVQVIASLLVVVIVVGGILLLRHSKAALPAKPSPNAVNQPVPAGAATAQSYPVAPGDTKAAPSSTVNIAGKWEATVTYDWPGAVYPEKFNFEIDGAELSGTASFLQVDRGIFNGKVAGDRVIFTTKTASEMDDKITQDQHYYKGTVAGDTIRFSMLTDSSTDSHVPIHFTAKRLALK